MSLFEAYDPLKGKMFQILRPDGTLQPGLKPPIDDKETLTLYQKMVFVRLADQRRMLAAAAGFRSGRARRRLISLQSLSAELSAVELKAWQDLIARAPKSPDAHALDFAFNYRGSALPRPRRPRPRTATAPRGRGPRSRR